MIDSRQEGTEARVSRGKSRWTQCGVWGAVCGLVVVVYAYGARSGVLESMGLIAADTYYNLLVQGFRAGHLSLKKEVPPGFARLADPYDPAANALYQGEPYRMLDMSYYKGRLYLYYGVTPALILFWPFVALTGHYLFHRQAVAIFCAVGFLASAGLLRALWRRYFADVSIGVVAACVLALGLATGMPVLLTRSEVYEVPISCGYMLVMLALGALWRALHEPPRHRMSGSGWLAAASVAYGLAVGARPSLLFGAGILLVPVAQAWRERRPILVLLVAATGPIFVIGLGLMLYNALRFENPFEFGLRYQLSPERMDTAGYFTLRYLWFHIRVYFLGPACWSSHFPFVQQVAALAAPLDQERVFGVLTSIPADVPLGILTNLPLVWLAPLGVGLAWRDRSPEARSNLRWFLATVALYGGICALTICLFRGGNMRYEVEFLPGLVLLAAVGIFGLERALAPTSESGLADRPVWRWGVRAGWGVLLSFSVAINLLVGVVNYVRADCYMGNALFQAGKAQEAIGHYEKALRVMPDLAEAQNNLGSALLNLGRFEDAIGHLEQALRINPKLPEAHNNLGIVLERVGKIEDAIGHYEQAVRIKPDYAEAHYDLGNALLQLDRIQDAIDHHEQALRFKPDFAEAHNSLGVALHRAGRLEDGIAHLEESVRLRPDYAEPHFNLGIDMEQAGRIQDAIRHYEQAVRIKPDFAEAQARLATLRARLAPSRDAQ